MPGRRHLVSTLDSSASDILNDVVDFATSAQAHIIFRKPKLTRLTELLFGSKRSKSNLSVLRQAGSLDTCLTSEQRRQNAPVADVLGSAASAIGPTRCSEPRIFLSLSSQKSDRSSLQPAKSNLGESLPPTTTTTATTANSSAARSQSQLQLRARPQPQIFASKSSFSTQESVLYSAPTEATVCTHIIEKPPPRTYNATIQFLDFALDATEEPAEIRHPDPHSGSDPNLDQSLDSGLIFSVIAAESSILTTSITQSTKLAAGSNSNGAAVQSKCPSTVAATGATGSVAPNPHRDQVTLRERMAQADIAVAPAAAMFHHQYSPPSLAPPPSQPPSRIELLAMSSACPKVMQRPHWCLEDYVLGKRLYRSASASVYAAVCLRSGLQVALKVYSLAQVPANVVHMIRREVKIQTMLVHKNIVTLYSAFQDLSSQRLILVQEFAPNGSLLGLHRTLCCRMNESQARKLVLRPLLEAMSYLHSLGIVHRDIKPDNILFSSDWRLLLADFGVAINSTEERAVTRAGTIGYMAPEVERCPLKMLPEDNKLDSSIVYTTAADVWGIGCLTYLLLLGFLPFTAANGLNGNHNHHNHCADNGKDLLAARQVTAEAADDTAATAVSGSGRTLTFPSSTSPLARDFILAALAERPEDRPTATQLLHHPWMGAAIE